MADTDRQIMPDLWSILIGYILLSSLYEHNVSGSQLFHVPTVYQRIYQEVTGIEACFRLINATSQIGCSASPKNVSGVLWYAESQDNISSVLNDPPHSPYIVILEPDLFTSENIQDMKESKHVDGIIFYYDKQNPIIPDLPGGVFSPGKTCPNNDLAEVECDRSWNINGSGLNFMDFNNFAVFAITNNDSYNNVLKCYEDHNRGAEGGNGDFPLCSAELEANMDAVLSTPECYERANVWTNLGVPQCIPLGDKNVWGTLFEIQESQDIIIVATKLDSNAFIPYLSYGANNEVAGIVTQLAVADALGRMKRDGNLTATENAIMFVFYQGESYDYIGSSRMVYDMLNNKFPYKRDSGKQQPPLLNLTNITAFVELSHVGIQRQYNTESPVYYLHTNQKGKSSSLHDYLINITNESITFNDTTADSLPPASAQMFHRRDKNVPVIIVSDYDTEYNNKLFGSHYDILENLIHSDMELSPSHPLIIQLQKLATSLATALLDVSNATVNESPEADPEKIIELLDCYLVKTNCSLFREVLSPSSLNNLGNEPLSRYVTVNTVTNLETEYTFNLLANFTGVVNDTIDTCKKCEKENSDSNQVYTFTPMSGDINHSSDSKDCICVKSFTHYHEATSPAFDTKDYNSKEYSTWAESNWSGIGMRIYLVTFPLFEVAILLFGLALFTISVFVTWQCNRKGRQIFAVTANSTAVHT